MEGLRRRLDETLTLARGDGARLYIWVDGAAGVAYLTAQSANDELSRQVPYFGNAATQRALRQWHEGMLDLPAQGGDDGPDVRAELDVC